LVRHQRTEGRKAGEQRTAGGGQTKSYVADASVLAQLAG
jgi:hypothetical protein